jgi:hypothetical protein
MVDYIMGSTYAEIDLDENPCIIPSCGHILTLESMDGHMEIAKYYTISDDANAEDSIIALKSSGCLSRFRDDVAERCRRGFIIGVQS